MGVLGATAPVNIASEKSRWEADMDSYSPRFRYKDSAAALAGSNKVQASSALLHLAVGVLRGVIGKYGSESGYHEAIWGEILSREQADGMVSDYIEQNGMTGLVRVVWSEKSLVTSFSQGKGTKGQFPGGTLRLVARPGYYRRQRLIGLLDHELGTHFTRSYNTRALPPSRPLPSPGYFIFLASEEGLASLNTHQYLGDASLFQPALLYWSCWRASTCSFAQLNREMSEFVDDPSRRWVECVRAKRGLEDTSLPGGLAKDQSTFDGLVRILRFRKRLDFGLMHSIKVSLENYEEAVEREASKGRGQSAVMPCFLRDVESYRSRLDKIAADNDIACEVPAPGADSLPISSRDWEALGFGPHSR